MKVAVLSSQGHVKQSILNQAYKSFGIDPGHAVLIKDEHIIGSYKSRLADISLAAAEDARKQLRIIGDARNSDLIRSEASDSLETYAQALSWLDMGADEADDFVPTRVAIKVGVTM